MRDYNTSMFRVLMFLAFAPLLFAQADEIRAMLINSEAAWNRGDLAAFASDYEDAPTTTFIGREVTHGGVAAILARYQRGYPTAEARGTLTFSEIEVRPLGEGYALANGKFTLSSAVLLVAGRHTWAEGARSSGPEGLLPRCTSVSAAERNGVNFPLSIHSVSPGKNVSGQMETDVGGD